MNSQTPDNSLAISFFGGATGEAGLPEDGRPQIVLAGRSNVGKSSIVNSLAKSAPARSAKKPGKTTEINFYAAGNSGYLVDLPGFGYAKMSVKKAQKLRKQMLWYLVDSSANIAWLVVVCDVRRGISDKEKDLISIAEQEQVPYIILANKVDKCNQKELHQAKEEISQATESFEYPPDILPYSAKTGRGVPAFKKFIMQIYE